MQVLPHFLLVCVQVVPKKKKKESKLWDFCIVSFLSVPEKAWSSAYHIGLRVRCKEKAIKSAKAVWKLWSMQKRRYRKTKKICMFVVKQFFSSDLAAFFAAIHVHLYLFFFLPTMPSSSSSSSSLFLHHSFLSVIFLSLLHASCALFSLFFSFLPVNCIMCNVLAVDRFFILLSLSLFFSRSAG